MSRFFSFSLFSLLFLLIFQVSAQDAVHRRISVEQPAQRSTEASAGLDIGWPEPVPSQGLTPFALGLIPPAQFPNQYWDVTGVRLNLLAGLHNNVAVFDIGTIANLSLGEVNGIELAGVWNQVRQDFRGIQFASFLNQVYGDAYGAQFSAIANYNGPGEFTGLQIAAVNINQGNGSGVQIGLYNQAQSLAGIQIGLVNTSEDFYGMQLGIFNYIRNSPLPFMVLLNLAF